jgi:23S rRNA (cytidine1920-2'-O)/16S rRNA (cytidine1409-2'-O)-methyltransferase
MCARPRFRHVLTHVRAVRPDISDPLSLIDERRLAVDGVIVTDPGALVRADASVIVRKPDRLAGQRKLDAALAAFGLDVCGATCIDLGAAAGGFTRSLLVHGARHVYAVDVGFGQLRGALTVDRRVTNLERTNLADAWRHIPAAERIDVLTADLSFLSLADALPQLRKVPFAPGAIFVGLVKPQFELGLRRQPIDISAAERSFAVACEGASRAGWEPVAGMRSPIRGKRGSREFFFLARCRLTASARSANAADPTPAIPGS